MEEQVGKLWHNFITRRVATGYPEAAVSLHELISPLATFYRAVGGNPARTLGCADRRVLRNRLSWLQRLASTEQRFAVAWQDEKGLYLPERIELFPRTELNRTLYFWLAAMAARLPLRFHWFRDNQRAARTLLERYPGFTSSYAEMVAELLVQRARLPLKTATEKLREQAIARALENPLEGSELSLPEAEIHPVPLWIYPALSTAGTVAENEEPPSPPSATDSDTESVSLRKQGKRVDDKKKTDGLLVFLPESLFTWSERINVDRSEDDSFDEEAPFIARELEEITLGERRDGLASRLKMDLDLPSADADDYPVGRGIRLPEWHYKRHAHLENYCLLQPLLSRDAQPAGMPPHLRPLVRRIKGQLDSFRLGRQRLKKQPFGDEVNLDAWLDHVANPRHTTGQNFFNRTEQHHRDLSTLILADLSLSTEAAIDNDHRVIDVIRDALLLFAETLHTMGDPFAMYGFSSVRNKMVRYHILKNFSEHHDDRIRGRIQAIKPGFYTRLGAAIRQSTRILSRRPSEQKLLLIISDGKPNDIDRYEGRYGVEDTRKAVHEARAEGITPFCITVDAEANSYLPYLFGSRGYSVIHDTLKLPRVVPEIYLGLTQ